MHLWLDVAATGGMEVDMRTAIAERLARRLTPKEHRFVLAYVQYGEVGRAARAAGYGAAAEAELDRLLGDPDVQAEVVRPFEMASEELGADRTRLIRVLLGVVGAGMSQFIRIDENGQAYVDLTDALPEQLDAVQDLRVEERVMPDGTVARRTTIKLYDRLKAVELLAKLVGAFAPEKLSVTTAPSAEALSSMSPEDAAKAYRAMLEASGPIEPTSPKSPPLAASRPPGTGQA